LVEYINNADSKKVKALFTLVENDMMNEAIWNDKNFITDLNNDVENYLNGKEKGYTLAEVKHRLKAHRSKAKSKTS
jgi:transcriptional regulator of heat shock response